MNPVFLDTETTGLDPDDHAELCELACVAGWAHMDTFVQIDAQAIPAQAKAVHHITEEMAATGITRSEARQVLVDEFIQKCPDPDKLFVVAHNVEFDRKFLPEFSEIPWVCTFRLARHLWPGAEAHNLQFLRYWLNLDVNPPSSLAPHRAMYDTICCAALYNYQLKTMADRGMDLYSDPAEFAHFVDGPVLLDRLNFGKHKGKRFTEIPRDYLQWMQREERKNPGAWDKDTMHTIQICLGGGVN